MLALAVQGHPGRRDRVDTCHQRARSNSTRRWLAWLERDTQREPQPARRDGAVSIDRARFPEQVLSGAAQF